MSKFTPERIQKVLADINARVPKLLRDNVVKTVKKTPDLERLAKDIIDGKVEVSEEQKKHIKILYEAGDFSKEGPIENPRIAKQIDEFINREIKKEIRKGNLPKMSDAHKYLPKFNEEIHHPGSKK